MPIAFLHTAPANVAVFRDLVARLSPGMAVDHATIEDVLREAIATGTVTADMRAQTRIAIETLIARGATLVVCTCSTIGGVAEAVPVPAGVQVLRVDRPMAEAAVASGRRMVIAAALPSTLGPTLALLRDVATRAQRTPEMVEVLCADAWPAYQRGDLQAYAEGIAGAVRGVARAEDIIVLAQASMAPAVSVLAAMGLTALASPELGVRAALARAV